MTETRSESRDPIVEQRIKEEATKVQAEIDETNQQIEAIERSIQKSPWLRLQQSLGRDFDEKRQLWGFGSRRSGLKYELENLPDKVAGQIYQNRHSHQLYWLRNFFGDPVHVDRKKRIFAVPYLEFPYDGGADDKHDKYKQERNSDERTFCYADDVMRTIKNFLSRNGKITLYDTSDPRPQMRHEVLIDVLTKLGFVIDESVQRGIAAMRADTGIDPTALDYFEGRSYWRPGHRFIKDDWLNFNKDGTVSGYLRAQGDSTFAGKKFSPGQPPELNPVLSQLCQEWQLPHLYAELVYKRDASDTKVALRIQKEQTVVDATVKDAKPPFLLHQ